jgi:hypothetical protein
MVARPTGAMAENALRLLPVSPLTQSAYHDCPVCSLPITSADGECVSVELGDWPALLVHVPCAGSLGTAINQFCAVLVPSWASEIRH